MEAGFSTALRSSRSSALVTAAGANAKLKFYNGSRPATGEAATTLLATLVAGAVLGTVSAGALTIGAVTQTNSAHVNGAPTWLRLTTSTDVFIADFDIGGADGFTFAGTIATGVDISASGLVITEGNS